VEGLVDTSRGDCASSANWVSPATLDEHEGATLHEDQFVDLLSPSWPTRASITTFQMSSRSAWARGLQAPPARTRPRQAPGDLAIALRGYAIRERAPSDIRSYLPLQGAKHRRS
jgi:hypothetical protein